MLLLLLLLLISPLLPEAYFFVARWAPLTAWLTCSAISGFVSTFFPPPCTRPPLAGFQLGDRGRNAGEILCWMPVASWRLGSNSIPPLLSKKFVFTEKSSSKNARFATDSLSPHFGKTFFERWLLLSEISSRLTENYCYFILVFFVADKKQTYNNNYYYERHIFVRLISCVLHF